MTISKKEREMQAHLHGLGEEIRTMAIEGGSMTHAIIEAAIKARVLITSEQYDEAKAVLDAIGAYARSIAASMELYTPLVKEAADIIRTDPDREAATRATATVHLMADTFERAVACPKDCTCRGTS